jgi:hypothetical protein
MQFFFHWSETGPVVSSIPLSYVHNGVQRVTGFPSEELGGWYDGGWGWERYIWQRARYAMDAEATTRIDMAAMFADGSAMPGNYAFEYEYHRVDEPHGWTLSGAAHVRSNGNWDFFPEKVRYERYEWSAAEDQPERPEWKEYIRSVIAGYEPLPWQTAFSGSAPVVITEAWFFTWGGIEMAMVNASNMIDRGRTRAIDRSNFTPNPPHAEDTVLYHVTVLFMEGHEPLVLYNSVSPGPSHEPYGTTFSPNGTWLPDETGDEWFWESVQWFDVIQYGEDGSWMVCPMFFVGGHDWTLPVVSMMLIDLDGCGGPELVIHWPSQSRGIIQIFSLVYDQVTETYRNFSPF